MISRKFLSFCLVGAITFFLDYGLLYLLTEYGRLSYLLSSALAFSVAVIINYILCQRFVFVSAKNGVKQLTLFVITSVVGLGINQLCMWLFVECALMHYMLAKIFATGIVTVWNYVTKKFALEH